MNSKELVQSFYESDFYKNPDAILGKIITVQYFEETKNQEGGISLRFPTFKILHGEVRTVWLYHILINLYFSKHPPYWDYLG